MTSVSHSVLGWKGGRLTDYTTVADYNSSDLLFTSFKKSCKLFAWARACVRLCVCVCVCVHARAHL